MTLWRDRPYTSASNWTCVYSPSPTSPECGAEALWHGFLLNADGSTIDAMTACCDDHRPVMTRNVDYVHPLTHPCGIPGSRFRWPENVCHMDDWTPQVFVALAAERVDALATAVAP